MLNELTGAIALGLLWTLMTFGVYISYRVLDIADLTVEGSLTLGASVAAVAISTGVDPYLALALSFAAGMAAGLATGLLHTALRIPALLSGILTMIALWSVNLRIMGKANVSLLKMPTVFSPFVETLGMNKNIAMVAVGIMFVAAAFAMLYWFFGTETGCAVRATGNNAGMARAQGVNTDAMKILGLVISNGLVALSGGLIAQSQTFADIQMGTGAIVIGLASLIIGEVLFGKKSFFRSLVSMVLGAITYRLIIALVLKLGMSANDLKLFTAIIVAAALSLPMFSERLKRAASAHGGEAKCRKV